MEKTPASIIYSDRLLLSNANLIYNPTYIISQHIYILKLTGFFKTQQLHGAQATRSLYINALCNAVYYHTQSLYQYQIFIGQKN